MKTKFVFLIAIIALAGMFASCPATEAPPETVTVTFNSDGGSAVAPVTLTKGETLGGKYTKPAKANLFFGGWFEGVTEYDQSTVINVDVTLKASWLTGTGIAVVTFDTGENGIPANETVTVIRGKSMGIKFPQEPRRRGYKFEKWQTADGTEFTSRIMIQDNITVTAQWTQKSEWTVTLKVPAAHQSVNTGVDGTSFKVYDGDLLNDWEQRFPTELQTGAHTDPNRFYSFSRWSDDGTKDGLIYTERTPITKNVTLTGYYINNFYAKEFPVDLTTYGYYNSDSDSRNTNPPNYSGALTTLPTGSSGTPARPNSTVLRTPAAANIVYYAAEGTLTLGSKTISVPAGAVSAKFNANPSFLWFYTPETLLKVIGMNATLLASVDNETKFSFSVEADLYDEQGNLISPADTNYQINVLLANLRWNDNWNATAVNGWCLDQINGKMDGQGNPILELDEDGNPVLDSEGNPKPIDPPVPLPQNVVGTIVNGSNGGTNGVQNRYWVMFRARSAGFVDAPATMVLKSFTINLLQ